MVSLLLSLPSSAPSTFRMRYHSSCSPGGTMYVSIPLVFPFPQGGVGVVARVELLVSIFFVVDCTDSLCVSLSLYLYYVLSPPSRWFRYVFQNPLVVCLGIGLVVGKRSPFRAVVWE